MWLIKTLDMMKLLPAIVSLVLDFVKVGSSFDGNCFTKGETKKKKQQRRAL